MVTPHGMGASYFFEHAQRAHLEREERKRMVKHRSKCLAKHLQELAGPCRCSGMKKNSHLYHNYRPIEDPLCDLIERVVEQHEDAPAVLVCAAACISRFSASEGIPLCRDQVSRLAAVSLCVNIKFWDDLSGIDCVNLHVATTCGIPRDDFNAMEMSFLRSLGWNVSMGAEAFEEWAQKLDGLLEMAPSFHGSSLNCSLSASNCINADGAALEERDVTLTSPAKSSTFCSHDSEAEADANASGTSTLQYASMSDSDGCSGYASEDKDGAPAFPPPTSAGKGGGRAPFRPPLCSEVLADKLLSSELMACSLHANSLHCGQRRSSGFS